MNDLAKKRAESYMLADEKGPHHWDLVVVWVILDNAYTFIQETNL